MKTHLLIDHYECKYCRSDDIREVLIFEIGNSRIQNFTISPEITNSQKSKHSKITRPTVVPTMIHDTRKTFKLLFSTRIYVLNK